jgi:alkylation response protein AidB-like acyl-CoA dehydrogenase
MAVAPAPYTEKTDEQKAITEMVRQFADEQILPNAEHYDHEDLFPGPIVEQMKELGLFGVTIPEEYGGMGLDLTTYAMIVEELSRGWISISGVINTHFIGSYLLMKFGSEEQKQKYLPRMATGEIRAAFSLSEPELGSDVQAIKTSAKKLDDGAYEINGQKMWVTNGLMSSLVFVLVKTDPDAQPRHKGFTCFIAEKEGGVSENTGEYAGLNVPPKIKKLGYKGVESTELVFDGYKCPAENVLGGEQAGLNRGFAQMMDALEVGRVNVAARGVGIAQRALELALRYSQERKTFGKPIAEHQAIQFKLADMATQVDAARLLTLRAAPEGCRRALGPRGRHGQAVRLRGRPLLRGGVLPHPRRLRLLQGVRDRAPVPRRAVAVDRRGHLGDPAYGDRQEAAAAPQDLTPPRGTRCGS